MSTSSGIPKDLFNNQKYPKMVAKIETVKLIRTNHLNNQNMSQI